MQYRWCASWYTTTTRNRMGQLLRWIISMFYYTNKNLELGMNWWVIIEKKKKNSNKRRENILNNFMEILLNFWEKYEQCSRNTWKKIWNACKDVGNIYRNTETLRKLWKIFRKIIDIMNILKKLGYKHKEILSIKNKEILNKFLA